jgi:hypothetical protein
MNKFSNVFGQILKLFPRTSFENLVRSTGASSNTKGFSCWDQFVAMLFCQLGQAHSLREICGGLASMSGKLRHLGLSDAPSRSTLAYANEHRPWQLYEKLFYHLLGICKSQFGNKHKFHFKNKLLSFDASTIELCLSTFDWAKFRRAKGAIKLHLLLDHDGYLPQFLNVTPGNVHEVNILKRLSFDPGTIIAFDRGLLEYAMMGRWTKNGVYFVTRLKSNAVYDVVESRNVPENSQILSDQIIRLKASKAQRDCPYDLRIVEVWLEDKQETIIILTNNLELPAETIAAIYKDRWQIELFFKAIKQNLRIKTFVGTSLNAVMIQIWTALIAILILKYLQAKSKLHWSLSNLVAMLRLNLLTYQDVWQWIDNPYAQPSPPPSGTQVCLNL